VYHSEDLPRFGFRLQRRSDFAGGFAEKQRASVRVQEAAAAARNASFFSTSAPSPGMLVPENACEPTPAAKIREIVDEGARQSGLDADVVRAVVRKESAFNPCATSLKGAQGLMQLMPSVQMQFGVKNPYDPLQNVDAGTRLLKQLLGQYGGDLARALGAYNAGPARVEQWGGIPPFPETTRYVEGILSDLSTK
jgi:soluble lytic murein transglycosylase-like protein